VRRPAKQGAARLTNSGFLPSQARQLLRRRPEGTPWPDVTPDFTDANIAIARTLPEYDGQQEVR